MKYIKPALVAAAVAILAGVLVQPACADVDFDFAYSNLSHHGSWIVSAQYGHVWQPREYNREWNPYYDGHWVDTDMGWTWVSDYEWGAIPYHYGTWVADSDAGWVWIPGSVWAPSWVVFRTDSNYIGWAPVPPGFSVGVSIEMGASSSFIFVSSRDFLAPRVRTAIIPVERTNVFINKTTVINNIVIQNNVVINRGPDVRIVERATGRTIREERIESVARVAPFDHVTRAQLAVDPVRAKQGVRVAEPVPASRPLPSSDRKGGRDNQGQGKTAGQVPTQENAQKGNRAEAPAREATPETPTSQTEQRQQGRKAQARGNARAQEAPHPPTPRGDAPAGPATVERKDAIAQQRASEQAAAASANVERNKANARQRANQQGAADAQKARRDQTPPREPAAASSSDAGKKAKPEQNAKGQPKAKAKQDTTAKKDNPDKKDQGSGKDATPEAKGGTDK